MDCSDSGLPSIWTATTVRTIFRRECGVRTPRDRLTCANGKLLERAPGSWLSQVINGLSVAQGPLGACQGDGNEYTGYVYNSQEQGEARGPCITPRIPRDEAESSGLME